MIVCFSNLGGASPYQRTPANYAGGAGPNANNTITLHAQKFIFL